MTTIGTEYFSGQAFHIDTKRHIAVIGGSGMGKSTLMQNIFIDAIRKGEGGLFLDPHGDSADKLISYIPKSRIRDVVWFDPSASKVIPFNPLYFTDPEELELAKEAVFTTIKSQAGTAWGDESARIVINALDAVCDYFPRPTMVHVARFIADDDFRAKLLKDTENQWLKFFRTQYDEKLRTSEQMAKFSPPLNKLTKFMRSLVIAIVGQEQSFDLLEAMNSRKIIICRLSKGRLGEEVAQILGSLILAMISIAALQREKQKDRPQFLVAVDELPNFIHGGRISSLLAESRKYGISLMLGFQGLYQLPYAADVLSNCATQIVFNISGDDAEAIEKNWHAQFVQASTLTGLARYTFFCRTFNDNSPSAHRIKGYDAFPKRGDEVSRTKVIKHSLETYGKPRQETLDKISRFLSS